MKLLLILALLFQRGPVEATQTLYNSMDAKIKIVVAYNPQTLKVSVVRVQNDSTRSALPTLLLRYMGTVIFYNTVDKGATVVNLASGNYSMNLDPDTKKPVHPFIVNLSVPYGNSNGW